VNVYYTADVRSVIARAVAAPSELTIRPIAEADISALAETYLRAYHPAAADDLNAAVAEMKSVFDGAWGILWPEASPTGWRSGELVGVVQAVRRASMDDAPGCPWLIEVFTDPRHRRTGIARALVGNACRVMNEAGERQVGLTVDDGNITALAMYKSLGFSAAN
jgi:GNAT superfamily N-acetyltransferase